MAFPESEDDAAEDDVENSDLWQDADEEDSYEIANILATHLRNERLSCFDHTLHLVVADALKDTKCFGSPRQNLQGSISVTFKFTIQRRI